MSPTHCLQTTRPTISKFELARAASLSRVPSANQAGMLRRIRTALQRSSDRSLGRETPQPQEGAQPRNYSRSSSVGRGSGTGGAASPSPSDSCQLEPLGSAGFGSAFKLFGEDLGVSFEEEHTYEAQEAAEALAQQAEQQ